MSAEFPGNGLLCTSPRVMGVIARSTFVTSASIKKAFVKTQLVFEYRPKKNAFDSVFSNVL